MFIQRIFIILNIAVTAVFVLYLIRKILKPIFALTSAISEVKRERLEPIPKIDKNIAACFYSLICLTFE